MDTARVLAGTTEDLKALSPLIKILGSEEDLIREHQAGAAAGNAFLLAYAPSDLETRRLMNVARRVGFAKAHKYDRTRSPSCRSSGTLHQPRMIGNAAERPAVLRWS